MTADQSGSDEGATAITIARMTPGERVRLVKECADSLRDRPWAEAQLTLQEFGFATYDPDGRDDFDPHVYFLTQVQQAADSALTELKRFLAGEDALPATDPTASPWTGRGLNVFISHISAQKIWVSELKQAIGAWGLEGFVAHEDIEPSRHWRGVIQTALSTCHACVVLLHDGFHQSQWCDQEIGWAMSREIPVVPVDLTSTSQQHGFLAEVQFIKGRGRRTDELADCIWHALHSDSRTMALAQNSLVEALVNSWSYNRTRQLWERIAALPTLTGEQLRRLEYAAITNGQVRDANYNGELLPSLIAGLVLKFDVPPS